MLRRLGFLATLKILVEERVIFTHVYMSSQFSAIQRRLGEDSLLFVYFLRRISFIGSCGSILMGIESMSGSDCENRMRICMMIATTNRTASVITSPCQVQNSLVHRTTPTATPVSRQDQTIITYIKSKTRRERRNWSN